MNKKLSAVRFKTTVSVCKVEGLPKPMKALNTNLFSVTGDPSCPGRCRAIEVDSEGWVYIHGTATGWPVPLVCRAELITWALPAVEPEAAPVKRGRNAKTSE